MTDSDNEILSFGPFRLAPASRPLPRHQTLHALLDWSYGLLAEPERLVLRRLSIFVGTFTLEGGEAVAAGGDLSEIDFVSTIDHLVTKSLVSAVTAEDGVTRYRLLEMTRAFATDKLVESGEETAIARRHARSGVAVGFHFRRTQGAAPGRSHLRSSRLLGQCACGARVVFR